MTQSAGTKHATDEISRGDDAMREEEGRNNPQGDQDQEMEPVNVDQALLDERKKKKTVIV